MARNTSPASGSYKIALPTLRDRKKVENVSAYRRADASGTSTSRARVARGFHPSTVTSNYVVVMVVATS
jgi:hypothetical protein